MVTTSSSLTASCGENARRSGRFPQNLIQGAPSTGCLDPSISLPCESSLPFRRAVSQSRRLAYFLDRASTTQSDEPFHIANLRNQFADFPYLHCSIGQRLLTLETCCGYEYGWDEVHARPRLFKGPPRRTGRLRKSAALPRVPLYLGVIPFQRRTRC